MTPNPVISVPVPTIINKVPTNDSKKKQDPLWQFFNKNGKYWVQCATQNCKWESQTRIVLMMDHLKEKHNDGPTDLWAIYEKSKPKNTAKLTPFPGCAIFDNDTAHFLPAQPISIPLKDGVILVQGHTKKDQDDPNYAECQNKNWPKLHFIEESNVTIYIPPGKTLDMKRWGVEAFMNWIEWVLSSTPGSESTIQKIRDRRLCSSRLVAALLKTQKKAKLGIPAQHFNLLKIHAKLVINLRKVQDFISLNNNGTVDNIVNK